jgi:predicted nucleotide-binding protein
MPDQTAVEAAVAVIDQRLQALRHVAELDRELPFAFGRAIAPFKAWQLTTCQRLADVGLSTQAAILPRLGYMGRGDPVLDISARIAAAGGYLEDLKRQLVADPSILIVQLERQKQERNQRMATNPRRVAVVHGRNRYAKSGMFAFLSALGLEPVDWDDAIKQTGKGAPHHREILDALFTTTQAVVVLLTPDEVATLIEALQTGAQDQKARLQARPNVWLEAGMALGVKPERTILVRFENHDEPSDIEGLDYIGFDGSEKSRSRLRERLANVQCAVAVRSDWLTAGQVEIETAIQLRQNPAVSAGVPIKIGAHPSLSEEARELLLAAAEDKNGHIMYSRMLAGLSIQTNGRNFVEGGSARSAAKWEGALKELLAAHLVQERGHKGELFDVTGIGYEVADQLRAE